MKLESAYYRDLFTYVRLRAGSHFDISISTIINMSTRKIRKKFVNQGYISISTGNGNFFPLLMLMLPRFTHVFFICLMCMFTCMLVLTSKWEPAPKM